MRNPFEELSKPKEDIFWEPVEGAFSCQEHGCFLVSGEAKYSEEKQILTWLCKEEHINRIEGFHIG